MTHDIWLIATFWMGLAFLASIVSIGTGVSVAWVEILLASSLETALV
jgi:hypothetical protein